MTSVTHAEGWRGLVPLHSTRLDVITLLGNSTFDNGTIYDTAEGRVGLMMAVQPCEPHPMGTTDKDWEMRNIVFGISINLSQPIPMNEIDFDWEKFYVSTNSTDTSFYNDDKVGISYSVLEGKVINISHGPTEKDLQEYYEKRKQCVQAK